MTSEPPEKAQPGREEANDPGRIYILPNLFTAGNLFFGFLAIIWCARARYGDEPGHSPAELYTEAVWFILAAGICDVLDGRVARLGGRESLFGKEFDSIADTVSFGLAPSLMVFLLILSPTESYPFFRQLGGFVGFVFLLCAAVRLARFNVLTNPYVPGTEAHQKATDDFRGLPAPAAAATIASIVLVLLEWDVPGKWNLLLPPLLLLIALLMVSNIPYPSFKHIDWSTRARVGTFIGAITLIAAVFLLRQFAFAAIVLGYVFYGLGRAALGTLRPRRNARAQAPEG